MPRFLAALAVLGSCSEYAIDGDTCLPRTVGMEGVLKEIILPL